MKHRCNYHWVRQAKRSVKNNTGEGQALKFKAAEAYLSLVALQFDFVFVDEFTVKHSTHVNYNWVRRGTVCGIPLAGKWESISCIAAVSRRGLVKL